jgi:lysyl-tRNA synthetase class 1
MIWVDRTIEAITDRFAEKIAAKQPLTIRDEKTLSGRVHVGSLRGIAIHGIIAQALTEKGVANEFKFELNDNDHMDEIPATLEDRESYRKFMGQPLFTVPPHITGFENYPMIFGTELQGVTKNLGFPIHYYNLRPLYESGKFNETIRLALEHAKEIRAIYKEVSGSDKPEDWLPLQVICEKCGKVGTTQVTSWNGESVTYVCRPNLVKWAVGCGQEGTVSPFDGRAKLPWKVEWPAKWKVMGVDIEGAGKDHSAAGGSREIGKRIVEEVFSYPNPFDIPYEFFNLGGKKMSASKGIGASAKEVSDLLPPTLLRLLMIRKLPNQPIDFDPEGTTIPSLFDEYDRLSDHFFKRHKEPDSDFARTFEMCQVDFPKLPKDLWQMRFSVLSFTLQMPHLVLEDEAAKLKGSPLTPDETEALKERAHYVRQWLTTYAPTEYRFVILEMPPADLAVTDGQKKALNMLWERLADLPQWEGTAIHQTIHTVKEETGITPKELFAPLYQLFLGRTSGPQMGWFLGTFEKQEVLKRLMAFQ